MLTSFSSLGLSFLFVIGVLLGPLHFVDSLTITSMLEGKFNQVKINSGWLINHTWKATNCDATKKVKEWSCLSYNRILASLACALILKWIALRIHAPSLFTAITIRVIRAQVVVANVVLVGK